MGRGVGVGRLRLNMRRLFSAENVAALLLCLIVLLLLVMTTDSTPQWIYQGF